MGGTGYADNQSATAKQNLSVTAKTKPVLVKPAAAATTRGVPRSPERDAIVNQYGPLAIEVQALSARLRVLQAEGSDFTKLKDKIRSWYNDQPADCKFTYETERFQLELTERENEATPDVDAIVELVGLKRVLAICTLTQKAVKEELARIRKPAAFDALFTRRRTGDRTVKTVAYPKAA